MSFGSLRHLSKEAPVTKLKASLLIASVLVGLVGLVPSPAQAHADSFCVLDIWGPIFDHYTDKVHGGATVFCNGDNQGIAISGLLTKNGNVKDSDADVCNGESICSISMSANRGDNAGWWHVWAAASIDFDDGHKQRDPDRNGGYQGSGWKRSDCVRL
jgi:hypothetical protein